MVIFNSYVKLPEGIMGIIIAFGNWKILKVLVPKSSKIRQNLQIQRHYACRFMLPATCPATNILRHTWSGWKGTFTDICHPICYWHPVEPLITQTHTHTLVMYMLYIECKCACIWLYMHKLLTCKCMIVYACLLRSTEAIRKPAGKFNSLLWKLDHL